MVHLYNGAPFNGTPFNGRGAGREARAAHDGVSRESSRVAWRSVIAAKKTKATAATSSTSEKRRERALILESVCNDVYLYNGAPFNGAPFNGALYSVNKTLFDTI